MDKTQIILPHTQYSAEHLAKVTTEMAERGSPTIKAIWVEAYNAWVAIEGTHRLRAAAALGLPVMIDAVEYDADKTTLDAGLTADDWGGDVHTLERLVDWAADTSNKGGFVEVEAEAV